MTQIPFMVRFLPFFATEALVDRAIAKAVGEGRYHPCECLLKPKRQNGESERPFHFSDHNQPLQNIRDAAQATFRTETKNSFQHVVEVQTRSHRLQSKGIFRTFGKMLVRHAPRQTHATSSRRHMFSSVEQVDQVSGDHFVAFILIRMKMLRDACSSGREKEPCSDPGTICHVRRFEQLHGITTWYSDPLIDRWHGDNF